MDKMSLFSIFAVSVPEAILNIYFGFLVTGEKVHLYLDDKVNIVRLIISVSAMVITSVATRFILPNMFLVLIANIIIYMIILKMVYKLKWNKSFVTVMIFMAFIISIEFMYLFPVMTIFLDGSRALYSNDIWRFISSLPERFIQIFAIISLWNVKSALFNIKEYKKLQMSFIGLISLLLIIEAVFAFIFLISADILNTSFKVFYMIAFLLFSVINFLFFRFISNLANTIMKNDVYELIEYKKKVNKKIVLLKKYIDKGDIESAKAICKKSMI